MMESKESSSLTSVSTSRGTHVEDKTKSLHCPANRRGKKRKTENLSTQAQKTIFLNIEIPLLQLSPMISHFTSQPQVCV